MPSCFLQGLEGILTFGIVLSVIAYLGHAPFKFNNQSKTKFT